MDKIGQNTRSGGPQKYKRLRNAVRKETRKSRRNIAIREQKEVASQCKQYPKKCWNYVNCKRKFKPSIGDLKTVDIHCVPKKRSHFYFFNNSVKC